MLIETFLSCLSSKNSCSPILQLHRSMVVFCCHLVLDNFGFFPFACLFVVVVFFHTLLVCNFLLIYLFLDGLSHEKQLINAYAESKSHSSYFLRQDCRYIVCVHVYAMFTHIYWTSVPQRRYYADMKNKPPIASIYRFVLILKQKKVKWTFHVSELYYLPIASKINTLSYLDRAEWNPD